MSIQKDDKCNFIRYNIYGNINKAMALPCRNEGYLYMPAGQIIIFAYCILIIFTTDDIEFFSFSSVIMVVLSVILSALSYFLQNKYFTLITSGIYGIIALAVPDFITMSPLILYNAACFPCPQMFALIMVFIIQPVFSFYKNSPVLYCLIFFGIVSAFYIQYIQYKLNSLTLIFHKTRDDSTEQAILLKSRNQLLLEKQDYEIYNATLKERNRISREIHDNAGHLLSRSILLTGALKAINKDENCREPLDSLHETLDQAMTSIRESVHNLHDDSVNLKESIETIVNSFNFCNITLSYDMGTDVPHDIKFSFISIVKESLNNIYKHSNATNVNILLREHPAMYQLVIKDNGTTAKDIDTSIYMQDIQHIPGIGLSNIFSRVNMMNGTLKIHTNNGFCIFITIPKK